MAGPAKSGHSERRKSVRTTTPIRNVKSEPQPSEEVEDSNLLTPEQIKEQSRIIREKFEREHLLGYDPKSIRDRVARWQDRGGGVVPIDRRGIPLEECTANEDPPTPPQSVILQGDRSGPIKQKEARTRDRPALAVSRLRESSPATRQGSPSPSVKSTPRKRVISDEHWMKTASAPKIGASGFGTKRSEPKAKKSPKHESITTATIPPIVSHDAATLTSKKRDFTPPGAFPEEEPHHELSTNAELKDEVEVHQDESISMRGGRTPLKGSRKPDDSSPAGARRVTPLEKKTMRPDRASSGQKKGSTRTPASKNAPARNASKTSRKSSGRGFGVSILRDVFDLGKTPTAPKPATNSLPAEPANRLEAWLATTPDPFVTPEPAESPGAIAKGTIAENLHIPKRNRTKTASSEPRKRSDGRLSPKRNSSSRAASSESKQNFAKQSHRSTSARDPMILEPTDSSPGLRRTGARRCQPSRTTRPVVVEEVSAPIRQFLSTKVRPDPSVVPRLSSRQISGSHKFLDEARVLQLRDQNEMPLRRRSSRRGSKREKLASNADLISVLSMPVCDERHIRPARSVRASHRPLPVVQPDRPSELAVEAILSEFAAYEEGYSQELRTLVDGVVPVLINDALSDLQQTDYLKQLELHAEPGSTISLTQPVIEMGVSLEKLKNAHQRLPVKGLRELIYWADNAISLYEQYITAWRLDYQDVTITLAAASTKQQKETTASGVTDDRESHTDSNGEQVDVAHLLKRPLVRVKYIAKTLKAAHNIDGSTKTADTAARYEQLVLQARTRVADEKARLEDEAAASIDTSRARNLQTLGLQAGIQIDRHYHVKARDCFGMELRHGTGQQVDCKVEIILRDSKEPEQAAGDLLICEVDEMGRWLLFPPVRLDCVSARAGEQLNELVVMIRPDPAATISWYELLILRSEEDCVAQDWLQMLGLVPVPPTVNRAPSFLSRPRTSTLVRQSMENQHETGEIPLLTDSVIPLGAASAFEPSNPIAAPASEATGNLGPSFTAGSRGGAIGDGSICTDSEVLPPPTMTENVKKQPSSPRSSKLARYFEGLLGSSHKQALQDTKTVDLPIVDQTNVTLVEEKPSVHLIPDAGTSNNTRSGLELPTHTKSPPMITSTRLTRKSQSPARSMASPRPPTDPSIASPIINVPMPSRSPRNDRAPPIRPVSPLLTSPGLRRTPREHGTESMSRGATSVNTSIPTTDLPPPPPPHRTIPSRSPPPRVRTSVVTPILPPPPLVIHNGRNSSPLKHEYAPSTSNSDTSSETSYEDDMSTDAEHDRSSSETSEDGDEEEEEELEDGDAPTPLLPIGAMKKIAQRNPPEGSMYSMPKASSVRPDDSASQTGEADVTPTSFKTFASIWCWSDKGAWERLHQQECSIIVSAGLIEAFEITAMHSAPSAGPPRPGSSSDKHRRMSLPHHRGAERLAPPHDASMPLIGLELTPLVPLRRGTAVDISVRSPPTPRSRINSSNNIMFRARSPEECERLYSALNHARIYNPTYIALQNARPKHQPIPVLHRGNSTKRNSMWSWTSRQNSYRAKSGVPASLSSRSSAADSLTSAFSALKRLSGTNRAFDISKSTIHTGSRPGSVFTSSSGSSSFNRYSGNTTPPTHERGRDGGEDGTYPLTAARSAGEALGLSNAKIHLYRRETASKWRDLGSAKLSVLHADPSHNPYTGQFEPLKRVYITSKKRKHTREAVVDGMLRKGGRDEEGVLLDVSLPEQCFERVARTGIALSVWEERKGSEGVVGKTGGVVGGKVSVYMIQMKAEAETAYTYGLVGKMRY